MSGTIVQEEVVGALLAGIRSPRRSVCREPALSWVLSREAGFSQVFLRASSSSHVVLCARLFCVRLYYCLGYSPSGELCIRRISA